MKVIVFLYLLGVLAGLAFWTGVRLHRYQVSKREWLLSFVPGLNLAFLAMSAFWWFTRDRYSQA